MTFEEFMKLDEKEKAIQYEKLSLHDKYLARINAPIKMVEVEKNDNKLTKKQLETLKELEEFANKVMGAK